MFDRMSRQFEETVDTDDVTATMNNGVLTVTVPKAEPAESGRTIEVT